MSDCEDRRTDLRGTQIKNSADSVNMYADFTDYLSLFPSATTISSVSVSCTDDDAITLGTPSVVGTNKNVPWFNEQGQVVQGTIAANKGCVVLVGGGTAQEADAEPVRVWFTVTLSNGEIRKRAGRLRVE